MQKTEARVRSDVKRLPPTTKGHSAERIETPSLTSVEHVATYRSVITTEQPGAIGEVSIRNEIQSTDLRCLPRREKKEVEFGLLPAELRSSISEAESQSHSHSAVTHPLSISC